MSLSEEVKNLSYLTVDKMNEISMEIAREIVKDGFDMENLADIENHLMELIQERMRNLGCKFDKMEDFIWMAGLLVETTLYLGINIGRKLNVSIS